MMADEPLNYLEVDNPAEALRGADGEFEVTSPYGHAFLVFCRPRCQMSVNELYRRNLSGEEALVGGRAWRIRKLSRIELLTLLENTLPLRGSGSP